MKLNFVTSLVLFTGATFAAQIGDRYYSPFRVQIGDRREVVENEYGDPYVKGTRQIASRFVEVARYADKGRIATTVFYVKDTCVAVRLSSDGLIGPEDVLSLLHPFSPDGTPWILTGLDREGKLKKNIAGKDEIERYECSRLRNRRLATVTRTSEVFRGKNEIKSWDILIYSVGEKEVTEAIQKDKI
jgi:hypothetical protein